MTKRGIGIFVVGLSLSSMLVVSLGAKAQNADEFELLEKANQLRLEAAEVQDRMAKDAAMVDEQIQRLMVDIDVEATKLRVRAASEQNLATELESADPKEAQAAKDRAAELLDRAKSLAVDTQDRIEVLKAHANAKRQEFESRIHRLLMEADELTLVAAREARDREPGSLQLDAESAVVRARDLQEEAKRIQDRAAERVDALRREDAAAYDRLALEQRELEARLADVTRALDGAKDNRDSLRKQRLNLEETLSNMANRANVNAMARQDQIAELLNEAEAQAHRLMLDAERMMAAGDVQAMSSGDSKRDRDRARSLIREADSVVASAENALALAEQQFALRRDEARLKAEQRLLEADELIATARDDKDAQSARSLEKRAHDLRAFAEAQMFEEQHAIEKELHRAMQRLDEARARAAKLRAQAESEWIATQPSAGDLGKARDRANQLRADAAAALADGESRVRDLQSRMAEIQAEGDRMLVDFEQRHRDLEMAAQAESSDVKQKLHDQMAQLAQRREVVQQQNQNRLLQLRAALQAARAQVKTQVADLERAADQAMRDGEIALFEAARLQERQAGLEREQDEAAAMADAVRLQAESERRIAEAQREADAMAASIDAQKDQLEALKRARVTSDEELAVLQDRLRATAQKREQLLQNAFDEVDRLRTQADDLRSRMEAKRDEQAQVDMDAQRLRELEKSMRDAQKASEAWTYAQRLRDNIDAQQERLLTERAKQRLLAEEALASQDAREAELQALLQSLEEKLARSEAESRDRQHQIQVLRDRIDVTRDELAQSRNRLVEAAQREAELRARSEDEIHVLRSQLQQLENDLEDRARAEARESTRALEAESSALAAALAYLEKQARQREGAGKDELVRDASRHLRELQAKSGALVEELALLRARGLEEERGVASRIHETILDLLAALEDALAASRLLDEAMDAAAPKSDGEKRAVDAVVRALRDRFVSDGEMSSRGRVARDQRYEEALEQAYRFLSKERAQRLHDWCEVKTENITAIGRRLAREISRHHRSYSGGTSRPKDNAERLRLIEDLENQYEGYREWREQQLREEESAAKRYEEAATKLEEAYWKRMKEVGGELRLNRALLAEEAERLAEKVDQAEEAAALQRMMEKMAHDYQKKSQASKAEAERLTEAKMARDLLDKALEFEKHARDHSSVKEGASRAEELDAKLKSLLEELERVRSEVETLKRKKGGDSRLL